MNPLKNLNLIKNKLAPVLGGLVVLVLIAGIVWASANSSSSGSGSYGRYDEYDDSSVTDQADLESLALDHWDEVREYMSGSETINACSDSGCYDLEADISDGTIETVYFPNGGYIYPDAEIAEDGSADGYASDGMHWDFQVDVDSSLIQDAISEWTTDYLNTMQEEQAQERERDYR